MKFATDDGIGSIRVVLLKSGRSEIPYSGGSAGVGPSVNLDFGGKDSPPRPLKDATPNPRSTNPGGLTTS
jgi:hypothetical protein